MARKEKQTYETEKAILPNRLRHLLEETKTTQPVLAEYVGCTRQSVSLYATGQSVPDANALRKIAEFFDCTSDYLLGLSNTPRAEHVDIMERTGLSDNAINALARISAKYTEPENLNYVLGLAQELAKARRIMEAGGLCPTPKAMTEKEKANLIEYDQNRADKENLEAVNLLLSSESGLMVLNCIAKYAGVKDSDKAHTEPDDTGKSYDLDSNHLRAMFAQSTILAMHDLLNDIKEGAINGKRDKADS